MPNVTVSVPEDLREEMRSREEVNWSAVMRKAVQEHLRKLAIADAVAEKSELTDEDIEELDALVKQGMAEEYELA
jgi:post-segregation antitoxin (ccd killing protein)